MSGYICRKPIALSGTQYMPGDTIPIGNVLRTRELALIRSGHIVKAFDAESAQTVETEWLEPMVGEFKIGAPIIDQGKTVEVSVSPESVYRTFEILQLSEKAAKEACSKEEDDDALMLVNAVEHRKAVIAAANSRHETLMKAGDSDVKDV